MVLLLPDNLCGVGYAEDAAVIITFRRLTPLQRLLSVLWPPYRRRKAAELRQAIDALCDDPGLPCVIEGQYIPHGYGRLP